MGYTVQLGYETLPSCCAAIALGLFDDSPSNQDNSRALLIKLRLIAGIMLFVIWVIAALTVNRNIASENIAGFGLVLLSTSWRLGTHVNILVRLGALSFGIYLIHPLFVEGMQHILPKCGFAAGAPLIEVSIFFASLFVSTISVVLMRRWKGTRWLTG
jgi:peptidoglycan/LPS O-acetylase OafA/YrhL